MQRTCIACGTPFEAKRSTAKYCSSSCRAKVSTGAVVPIESRRHAQPDTTLLEAVRAHLSEVGRESHPLGLAALRLAETLGDPGTPPSAMAGLAKQLEATMASAVRGAKSEASPVERLRAQRDAKRAHG